MGKKKSEKTKNKEFFRENYHFDWRILTLFLKWKWSKLWKNRSKLLVILNKNDCPSRMLFHLSMEEKIDENTNKLPNRRKQ